jgi:hypothetical protein
MGEILTLCRLHHKYVLNQARQAHDPADRAPRSRPAGCQDRTQLNDRNDVQANSPEVTITQGVQGCGHLLRARTAANERLANKKGRK